MLGISSLAFETTSGCVCVREDMCFGGGGSISSRTPPKFNSSPLKSYRNPIGKDRLPTIHFQGRTVSFREGNLDQPNFLTIRIKPVEISTKLH